MIEQILQENRDLKKVLYLIQKQIIDFNISQLDKPVLDVGVSKEECKCNSKDEEIKALKEQISQLQEKLSNPLNIVYTNNEVNETVEEDVPVNYSQKVAEFEFPAADSEDPLAEIENSKEISDTVVENEEPVSKRTRKERGGSVFTDFKTLSLSNNNNYDGNTVIYSSKQ